MELRAVQPPPLAPDELLRADRLMRLGRAFDERMWLLNRSGRVAFVMPHQGNEATQAGIALAIRPGTDCVVPYYGDLTRHWRQHLSSRVNSSSATPVKMTSPARSSRATSGPPASMRRGRPSCHLLLGHEGADRRSKARAHRT